MSSAKRYPREGINGIGIKTPQAAQQYFLGWLSGYLQVNDPAWRPESPSLDGKRLGSIRDMLRSLLEVHAPAPAQALGERRCHD